jgi:membrane associated rhomboid family serine protease
VAPRDARATAEYAFALLPERFHAESPYRFQHWYESLGPILGHSFLHLGWWHAALNAFFLFGTSRIPAARLGAVRYLIVYFASVVAGAALFLAFNWNEQASAVGASGGVCGMFTAYFFSLRRSWRDALADPRARGPLGVLFLLNVVLMGIASEAGFFPIAWEAHLGGFLGGGVAYVLLQPQPRGPWA